MPPNILYDVAHELGQVTEAIKGLTDRVGHLEHATAGIDEKLDAIADHGPRLVELEDASASHALDLASLKGWRSRVTFLPRLGRRIARHKLALTAAGVLTSAAAGWVAAQLFG